MAAMRRGNLNWPDPDPLPGKPPMVDDVARMSAQHVERIFNVRTPEDIKSVIALARQLGKTVSMRGTRHSMGGHTIAAGGFVIDLMRLNKWSFDPSSQTVTAQPGCLWSDLIVGLNEYGYSPRTMQSYSTFSVGGSLAVNAHGITTDVCMAEAVTKFTLIMWDGIEHVCSRDAFWPESRELFGLALGGYGLFGVISEVTLRVSPNVKLAMEMLQLSVDDFPSVYEAALADDDGDLDVKMARLDVTNLENVDLFLFRRDQPAGTRTISTLTAEPHRMPFKQQIMYKWILPQLKEARYAVERAAGKAIDLDSSSERNVLMFESAEPLARLYSPLFHMDDTFVLQEFFVPKGHFGQWIAAARPAYALAASLDQIELLNTTIRFVHQDEDTVLAYSRVEGGSFAFVIYYRVHRTEAADEQLHQVHTLLAKASLDLGGTFYLPYRHHYTHEEMAAAYGPSAQRFFAQKQKFDPHGIFSNAWYEHYGPPFLGESKKGEGHLKEQQETSGESLNEGGEDSAFVRYKPRPEMPAGTVPTVSEHRHGSYRALLKHGKLRAQFRDQFLVRIFNVEEPVALYNQICKVARDPRNKDDAACFEALVKLLEAGNGALAAARRGWKQVRQLRAQKVEFLRETGSVLAQLGRIDPLVGYVSIGDHGKMVLDYQRSLGVQGKVWVVHDVNPDDGKAAAAKEQPETTAAATSGNTAGRPPRVLKRESSGIPSHAGSAGSSADLTAVIERGSTRPVGEYVPIDYSRLDPLVQIPEGACDLVTMHQGLHHLPQGRIARFLAEVYRILRPSGVFLVREHDATEELIPMLDMAHSIFNAVTGVPLADERVEIRAFRPILEWRRIIEAAGFVDAMVYEMEKGDPTLDEMMVYIKPSAARPPPAPDPASPLPPLASTLSSLAPSHPQPPLPLALHATAPPSAPPSMPPQVSLFFDSGPPALLDFLRVAQAALEQAIPQLETFLLGRLEAAGDERPSMLTPERVHSLFAPLHTVVCRFGPVLSHVQPLPGLASQLPLEEAFLLVRGLLAKESVGDVSSPLELMVLETIKDYAKSFGVELAEKKEEEGGAASSSSSSVTAATDAVASAAAAVETEAATAGLPRPMAATSSSTTPAATVAASDAPEVSAADVQALLERLLAAKPELGSPDMLERAGFPPRAISLVVSQLDGVGVPAVSEALSKKLDTRAFMELRSALEPLMWAGSPPLSYNRPGGIQEAGSHWSKVAIAVLGAPSVVFRSSAQMAASFVGLKPVIDMWKAAQAQRKTATAAIELEPSSSSSSAVAGDGVAPPPQMSSHASAQVRSALMDLETSRYEVTAELDDGESYHPIGGVREVLQAVYREYGRGEGEAPMSIVCTELASAELLEVENAGGSPSEAPTSYTLHLHGRRVDKLLKGLGVTPRKPSAPQRGYKFGDLTRKVLRTVDGMVEQALEGGIRRVLYMQFRQGETEAEQEADPQAYLPRVTALVDSLDMHGQLRSLHRDDGEFTWFKLNEWMQVEIMEAFGSSLSHAAWYRFPYMEMLTMYFKTLIKEAGIVQDKFGFKKAWLSAAAIFDFVPGMIMAIYFAQLHLLGMPLRALWGSGTSFDDYAKEHTGDKAPIEQLLVRIGPKTPPDWRSVMSEHVLEARTVVPGLVTLIVPTFKRLTEALRRLSEIADVEVLRISNQAQVQVRVRLTQEPPERQLAALRSHRGLEVMFEYRFPVDGTGSPPPTLAALCVDVPYVLSTFRFCRRQQIDVMQVYDFWT